LKIADKVKIAIREGEGLTVEFKEKYTSRIDEDIVAFSNTRGGPSCSVFATMEASRAKS